MTAVYEVLPGLYRIESELGGNLLALHFITGERTLLIDSGVATTPMNVIYPALESIGYPMQIDLVLISHADADHHGGNAAIRHRSPEATIMCHALDRPCVESKAYHLRSRYQGVVAADDVRYDDELITWLTAMIGADTSVNRAVREGEIIELGAELSWEVLHTPGHTSGHLSLWQPERRVLVVQDAVLGRGVPNCAGTLLTPPPYYDVPRYSDTLRRMQALEPEWLLAAHYPVMHGATAVEFLAASLDFVEQAEQTVLEIVADSRHPLALQAIITALDGRLGPFAVPIQWVGPTLAHLRSHVSAGRIRRTNDEIPRTWQGI